MKGLSFRRNPAEVSGIILLTIAAAAYFVSPWLAAAVAFLYVLLCVLASFLPQINFFLPVISRGSTGKNMVSLTFDDGPTESMTTRILDLLEKYSMQATFFVSGINAVRHPDIVKDIISRGHSIGNHSYHHYPFLMLRSYGALYQEIFTTQEVLRYMGIKTRVFRPPVGIVNPKLSSILEKLEMYCVTFSCRALDAGNFFIKNISQKILKKMKADDIILLHDVPTRSKEDDTIFLSQIEILLTGIVSRGFKVVPLSVLINKEVMIVENPVGKPSTF